MSADTPDVLTACECGHSIDRHHAGTQRGECRTYNCFCTLKPSDVFAARVAAVHERANAAEAKIAAVEALADDFDAVVGFRGAATAIRAYLGGEVTP